MLVNGSSMDGQEGSLCVLNTRLAPPGGKSPFLPASSGGGGCNLGLSCVSLSVSPPRPSASRKPAVHLFYTITMAGWTMTNFQRGEGHQVTSSDVVLCVALSAKAAHGYCHTYIYHKIGLLAPRRPQRIQAASITYCQGPQHEGVAAPVHTRLIVASAHVGRVRWTARATGTAR